MHLNVSTRRHQANDNGEREQQQRGNELSWPTTSTNTSTRPTTEKKVPRDGRDQDEWRHETRRVWSLKSEVFSLFFLYM